ncbi:helix-turn-helix domain protein [Roseburia sp. CAG:380]|nr:helix-turn-helix domain protein [Roseburia sp. CAG:380]
MTNKEELEIAILRAGLTKHEVAKKLGLSDMGFYKKLNNQTEFKASEIAALQKMLHIKSINEIFFAEKVE